VGTKIPVSEETKRRLSMFKCDDETWDQFLNRLANKAEPVKNGAWSEEEAERARNAVNRSKESFER